MPFKSMAQAGKMFSMEKRGELAPGTAERWAKETPDMKDLPERVSGPKKAAFQQLKQRYGGKKK